MPTFNDDPNYDDSFFDASLEQLGDSVGDGLIDIAHSLRLIARNAPGRFEEVCKVLGFSPKRGFALVEFARRLYWYEADATRLHRIGWTRLQIILPYVDKHNRDELLGLAEASSVSELVALMKQRQAPPPRRYVILRFTEIQYQEFERVVLAYGGMRSGRTLVRQEAALATALLMVDK